MKTNILKKFMNILGDETKLYFSADEPVSIWLYIKKKVIYVLCPNLFMAVADIVFLSFFFFSFFKKSGYYF